MDQAMTLEQAQAMIKDLQAQVSKAQQKGNNIKVSDKGAVSVYGLGRFPVTLYMSQWAKLFERTEEIKAFIQNNAARLAQKEA